MDPSRVDPGLLVSLDALLAERSVTAAARRLGISQPALSARLARLRALFGDDLLVGNAHGMSPTPRAEAIRERLHGLLRDLDALMAEGAGFDPATAERRFAIAASDLEHALLMPSLLARLAAEAPGLRIAGLALDTGALAERMERGAVDLAVTVAQKTPAAFPARRLGEHDFRVVWRERHPRLGETIDLDAFCAECHVLVSPLGGAFRGAVDHALDAVGRTRRVVASLPGFSLVPGVIRASDLIAVVPAALARREAAGLRVAKLPVETDGFTLFLSWHPRQKNDPGHTWLRARVVEILLSR